MKDTLIIMTSPVGTGKRAFIEKARLAGLTIVEPTVEFLDATSAQEFKANLLHEIRSNIGKADFIFVPVGKPIVDLLRIEDIKFSTILPVDTPEMREYWGVKWEDKELFNGCYDRSISILKGTNPWNIHFEISTPGDTIEDVLLSLGCQISHQPEPTTMNQPEPKKTVIIATVLSQATEVCIVRNSRTVNLSMECLNIDPVLRDKTENYAEVWVKEVQARIGKMDVLFIPEIKEACGPLSKAGIEFVSLRALPLRIGETQIGEEDPHNPWGYVADLYQ